MEETFKTADIKIDYLKFRFLKNFDVPIKDLNKEYFNTVNQPYLIGNY